MDFTQSSISLDSSALIHEPTFSATLMPTPAFESYVRMLYLLERNTKLSDSLAQNEKEKIELQAEIQRLQTNLESQQQQSSTELSDLKSALKLAKDKLKDICLVQQATKLRFTELQEEASTLKAQLQNSQEETTTFKSQLEEYKSELSAAKQKIDQVEESNDKLQNQLDSFSNLQTRYDSLLSDHNALQTQHSIQVQTNQALETEQKCLMDAHGGAATALESQLAQLALDKSDLSKRSLELEAQVKKLQEENSELVKAQGQVKSQLSDENSDLLEKNIDLLLRVTELETNNALLRDEVTKTLKKARNDDPAVADLTKQHTEAVQKLSDLTKAHDNLVFQFTQLQNDKTKADTEVSCLNAAKLKLENELEKALAAQSSASDLKAQFEKDQTALKKQLVELIQEKTKADDELEKVKGDQDKEKAEKGQILAEKVQLETEKDKILAELDAIKIQKKSLEAENVKLVAAKEELDAGKAKVEGKLSTIIQDAKMKENALTIEKANEVAAEKSRADSFFQQAQLASHRLLEKEKKIKKLEADLLNKDSAIEFSKSLRDTDKDSLQKKIDSQTKTINDLTTEKAHLEGLVSLVQRSLTNTEKHVIELENEIKLIRNQGSRTISTPRPAPTWTCPACTFDNDSSARFCQMCNGSSGL